METELARIFGKLLYGSKFHKLSQSRGQQGIGISAAGMYAQPQLVNLTELVIHEIQVWGSRCGPFATAMTELALGNIEVELLIEAVYPLSDIKAAFEKLHEPACMKVLLCP